MPFFLPLQKDASVEAIVRLKIAACTSSLARSSIASTTTEECKSLTLCCGCKALHLHDCSCCQRPDTLYIPTWAANAALGRHAVVGMLHDPRTV